MQHSRLATALLVATGLAATVVAATSNARQRPVDDVALTATGRAVFVDVAANDGLDAPVQRVSVRHPPSHGTATVGADHRIRYVPAAGFTGRDSFVYLVKAGRDSGLARVTIDVGQALVLRGKVTDQPIANATVTGSVDGRTFTATADANGDYALELIATEGGMVSLAARGTGEQAIANFQSYVGDFDRLQEEAGTDGVLTRDENHQVQVTNVSTAQAVLARGVLDGEPITDDAALAEALDGLDYSQVMRAAAAIKLAVDEGFALPDGVPDTLSLLSSPGALDGFVEAVESKAPGALLAASNAIANDPELTTPVAPDSFAGAYNLIYHLGAPGTINVLNVQGDRFEFDADGTGALLKSNASVDVGMTWTIAGNQAVVTPDVPRTSVSFPVIPPHGQVMQRITEREYRVSSLGGSAGREIFAYTTTYDYTYPETPALSPGTTTETSTRLAVRDGAGLPFAASELTTGRWVLPTAGTPYVNANGTGADAFEFGTDGRGERGDGATYAWTLDADGRLLLDMDDGTDMAYERLATDDRRGHGVMALYASASGARASRYGLAIRQRAGEAAMFSVATATHSWLSGQTRSRADTGMFPFHLVFDAGTPRPGFHVVNDPTGTYATRIGWRLDPTGLLDAVYYREGNTPVHACTPGVGGCYIWQVRRWKPVVFEGDRAYVVEEFLVDAEGNGTFDIVNQRATFYDRVARPDFPVPAAKAARPASVPAAKAVRPAAVKLRKGAAAG